MPILDLQQRTRELGRIRIGVTAPTQSGKTRPAKLDRFRFTSASRPLLEKVAALYGGTVADWTPANGGPAAHEVITDARRVPILVPPQPVSQYYELWSGGGCQRRCDGITELLTDRACPCGPDPERRECKPTTRLNVVLRDVPGVGVWRLESHGYYAAVELPGVAELLAKAGGYVEAYLGLEERTAKRDGQTRRWMVPTIDIDIAPSALMAGQTSTAAVATAPERAALEAPRPDYVALAEAATTADAVGELWTQAVQAGHMDDQIAAALRARGEALRQEAHGSGPQEQGSESAPELVEAEIVPDDETPDEVPEDVWFDIIAAAGKHGWSTAEVEQRFAQANDGLHPSTASVKRLRSFLADLKGGRA
ncbi:MULTISPECIES: hypothetical protein [Streptomycetaceae]|uniref:recombination directionality factor n=1 Tax=Streptomycetaceae TaxID=2062 RepID=UPI0003717890|nr:MULTISPECIES: hypothetical protein [Streptomycetaceae]